MSNRDVINCLIKQRNLDWLYFSNRLSLEKERHRRNVINLKESRAHWRVISTVLAAFLIVALLVIVVIY